MPYVFNTKQHFALNFDSQGNCFDVISLETFKINAFSSTRFKFEFSIILEQLMYFEISSSFEGLGGDTNIQNPPTYIFHQIILHNMSQGDLDIKKE